jgi:hypothetical protein
VAVPKTLSSYRLEVRRLLHDATGKFWSDSELNDYVNAGRDRVAADTGCIRRLVTAYLSSGIEQYSIGCVTGATISAGGSGYADGTYALGVTASPGGADAAGTYTCVGGAVTTITITDTGLYYETAPTLTFPSGGGSSAAASAGIIPDQTLDIMNITPLWGNQRYPLRYMPWTEFNARMRTFTVNPQMPLVWSRYGTSGGAAFIQPVPDRTYECEFDTAILPDDLALDADIDRQLKYPYDTPVAYYACWKAKQKQQAFTEGEAFLNDYKRKILEAQAAVQMRRIPNPYYGYTGA